MNDDITPSTGTPPAPAAQRLTLGPSDDGPLDPLDPQVLSVIGRLGHGKSHVDYTAVGVLVDPHDLFGSGPDDGGAA